MANSLKKVTQPPRKPGKPRKMGGHFPVREFCKDWKSQGILPKVLKKLEKKLHWKIEKNTGKVWEIC